MHSAIPARLAVLLAVVAGPSVPVAEGAAENLIRNGSFEGGTLYWHGIEPANHRVVDGAGKGGGHALRLDRGYVMTAPFVAERGESFTISLWARGDRPGAVGAQMPPSAREVGTASKRLWMREAGQSAPVGTDWRRVSFTWKADVANDGFWTRQHYMALIGVDGDSPVFIDGVTVTKGAEKTADYVGYRPVEVVAECLDWPGFEGAKANLFEPGATVRVAAHASNRGARPSVATVRHQFFDYEGRTPLGPPVDRRLTLAPGRTESVLVPMTLPAKGCVIARVAAMVDGRVVDSSDLPLTSLAYPKAADRPDPRERFGASFAGGVATVDKFRRMGFRWIRWRPHSNGEDHLPVEPRPGEPWTWTWFDKELDEQEARGCSSHLVLYPPPAWVMEPGHPLPKDMRWKADDPRWDDLSVATTWDRFVREAVAHYRGRSVIFEIENEPEFDGWVAKGLGGEYARFTLRTARQIKSVAREARVMVNNVYAVPSPVNGHLFASKGWQEVVDVVSWHDYHAGRLADARAIRRMRQNMDEAGGTGVELWFNEGWAFTNTAVDEPIACTELTSAQSTDAIMASVAEMTAAGQEKTILFHAAYEDHGMSFWDYSGPGTLLWDWYNYPLPLVASWNVMAHHVGLSKAVALIRPPGASLAVFQDLRNGRGVVVAYADEGGAGDVTVALPASLGGLTIEDIMGNARPLAGGSVTLPSSGRVSYLYGPAGTPADRLASALAPLDRKNVGFASAAPGKGRSWRLPPTWEGVRKGSTEGSIARADGRPVWKLEQVWPASPGRRENYRPMTWTGTDWNVAEGGFGGQPEATLKDGVLGFGTRAAHGDPLQPRTAGLTFVAPALGSYAISGTAESRIWDGANTTQLSLYRKSAGGVSKVASRPVAHQGRASLDGLVVDLDAGDELVFLPQIEGNYAGGTLGLRDLVVTLPGGPPPRATVHRPPAVWEGTRAGSADGNPIAAGGRPAWRLDQMIAGADPSLPASYRPMVWGGPAWLGESGGQGGQPSVEVVDGSIRIGLRGPWNGPGVDHEKTAGLAFLAPTPGAYKIEATVGSRRWEGGASSFPFVVMKRDSPRLAEVARLSLPADGTPARLAIEVDLRAGHELFFLPRCPEFHNGVTCTIDGLSISRTP